MSMTSGWHLRVTVLVTCLSLAGLGMRADASHLRVWREEAAKGDAFAQHRIGLLYECGGGVPQDGRQAVRWYKRAARQDYAPALFSLGCAYEYAIGVHRDLAEAIAFYHRGAELGDANSQYRIAYFLLEPESMLYSPKAGLRWMQAAAEQGHAEAQHRMGLFLFKGKLLQQDKGKALRWWIQSARNDHARAAYNAGVCLARGVAGPRDRQGAFEWWLQAARQGHSRAQISVSSAYLFGRGTEWRPFQAIIWYRRAMSDAKHEGIVHLCLVWLTGFMFFCSVALPIYLGCREGVCAIKSRYESKSSAPIKYISTPETIRLISDMRVISYNRGRP